MACGISQCAPVAAIALLRVPWGWRTDTQEDTYGILNDCAQRQGRLHQEKGDKDRSSFQTRERREGRGREKNQARKQTHVIPGQINMEEANLEKTERVRFKIAWNIGASLFGRSQSVPDSVLRSCVCVLTLAGFYHILQGSFVFFRKSEEIQACHLGAIGHVALGRLRALSLADGWLTKDDWYCSYLSLELKQQLKWINAKVCRLTEMSRCKTDSVWLDLMIQMSVSLAWLPPSLPPILLFFFWSFFLHYCSFSTSMTHHQSSLLSSSSSLSWPICLCPQLGLLHSVSSSVHLCCHSDCDFSLIPFFLSLSPFPVFYLCPSIPLLCPPPASRPHSSYFTAFSLLTLCGYLLCWLSLVSGPAFSLRFCSLIAVCLSSHCPPSLGSC